jgi:hypothetical protein
MLTFTNFVAGNGFQVGTENLLPEAKARSRKGERGSYSIEERHLKMRKRSGNLTNQAVNAPTVPARPGTAFSFLLSLT